MRAAEDQALRVLLVEDDGDDFVLIRDLFEEMSGFELEWAAGYGEGLAALGRAGHDVCLLDYRLGERSGLELLREARRAGSSTPMIVMTGQGGREVDLAAMEAGAADYLPKDGLDAPSLERSVRYAFARTLRAVAESERRFRSLVQYGSDAVTVAGADGRVRYASPAVEKVLGRAPEELVGADLLAFVRPEDAGRVEAALAEALARAGRERGRAEYRFSGADGYWRWLDSVFTDLRGDPAVGGVVVNSRDVTERRELEDRLAHQASHDPLTGLPNRLLLMERLGRASRRLEEEGGAGFAVLFVDVDDFKVVNDSLGHQAGDELLAAVGERLRCLFGEGCTVARPGGDEFVVLVEGLGDVAEAERLAAGLLRSFEEPFVTGRGEFFFTASVGIAVGGPGHADPEALVREADTAMYAAKEADKARYAVFHPRMSEEASERLRVGRDLRTALERGEMEVFYQPKVDLRSGGTVGAEALLRWNHPERGLVGPGTFIPVAEETGLIIAIGRRVLREACRQTREWQRSRPASEPLSVSVNVSARQFRDPGFAGSVAEVLRETGLAPEDLALEITESVVMEDAAGAIEVLRRLKSLGVRLEIDDFGTGYSSFSYLKLFPIDALKIDRSFLRGLEEDPGDAAIVRAIVDLGHVLGLRTVAEGAETAEQLARLREMGCDMAQGYFFAAPLRRAEMSAFLSADLETTPDPQPLAQN